MPPFTSVRVILSSAQSQRTVAVSNTPPSNLGDSLSSNSLRFPNDVNPVDSPHTDNFDPHSLRPIRDTHPDGLSSPDKDGESNADESTSDNVH